jgi:hypothetical protein
MFKLLVGTKGWIKETKDKCNHEENGNGVGKGVVYMLNHALKSLYFEKKT